MGLSASDAANSRGLDPRAVRMLELRKKKRVERENSLRQDKARRELNALHARLSVLDREIQRLSVGERRNRADQSRGRGNLAHELADVAEVSKALTEEMQKFQKIQLAIGKERNIIGRLRNAQSRVKTDDAERQLVSLQGRMKQLSVEAGNVEAKRKRLLAELTQVEHEMGAIDAQRNRIMVEVGNHQSKINSGTGDLYKIVSDLEKHELEMQKLISEQDHQDSALRQLKAKLMREQREAKEEAKIFERTQQRLQGKERGIPSLERDRSQIEQQIRKLEQELRSGS